MTREPGADRGERGRPAARDFDGLYRVELTGHDIADMATVLRVAAIDTEHSARTAAPAEAERLNAWARRLRELAAKISASRS
jgi:hypothetical protein